MVGLDIRSVACLVAKKDACKWTNKRLLIGKIPLAVFCDVNCFGHLTRLVALLQSFLLRY